jgi:two-component system phosphate regulon response regulator PhoB
VIEDDSFIRNLLRTYLEHRGFDVQFAETYTEGEAAIDATKPRAIILDILLPDGDGLDLLRHIREDLGRTEPVIVMTALHREQKYVEAFERGATGFVTKPFDLEAFGERIERVLVN